MFDEIGRSHPATGSTHLLHVESNVIFVTPGFSNRTRSLAWEFLLRVKDRERNAAVSTPLVCDARQTYRTFYVISRVFNMSRWLRWIAAIALTISCGCAAKHPSATSFTAHPSAALQPAQSDTHIYVTSGDLNGTCYQDLGPVSVDETYSQSVVESPDLQAEQLRKQAREKFDSKANAVIKVHEQQNEAGTAVTITGQAVRLENHPTVACAARGMPAVADTAAAAAGGGIVGTVIGGLAGDSVYGAEAGGAIGATAGAGMEIAKHRQEKQAQEAFIGDRLEQQRKQITQLYQKLAKLIGQQCDAEELTEEDCEHRLVTVQQEIAKTDPPVGGSNLSANSNKSGSGVATDFEVRNRIQEQQEIINKLERQIAQMSQDSENH